MGKRAFDLTVAACALIIAAPLMLFIAFLVKLDSPGPVFYRGRRVGRGGSHFSIYKFRTMAVGASASGPGVTRRGDARITRVGRFLRASKLDELPQLINVLRGSMSIVGPRPEDPRYVASYSSDHRRVLSVRPGVISPASLEYRHEERILAGVSELEDAYVRLILPSKLALDLAYIDNQSMLGDMRVLLRLPAALVRRSRA
jgi:lipopolysaccharide/colanic/teichoic acid biosynthesis glycosyltransferase